MTAWITSYLRRTPFASDSDSYYSYYNETRTHLSLDKDAPLRRAVQRCGTIVATPILSGLHHHTRGYDFREGHGQFAAIHAVAPSFGLEVIPLNVRDGGEIERAVTSFACSSNGGLIVTGSGLAGVNGELIVTLAARYKLPAVYYQRFFVRDGGLISYGPNTIDP